MTITQQIVDKKKQEICDSQTLLLAPLSIIHSTTEGAKLMTGH